MAYRYPYRSFLNGHLLIMKNNDKLQKSLQYQFEDPQLLKLALTHRSAAKKHNERLEFLGDGILNLTIAQALYNQFPNCNEGELSRMRATLVREKTLVILAHRFNLSEYIVLGPGELKSGGFRRDSILADAVEAIIGAISLDKDLQTATNVVKNWYMDLLAEIKPGEEQKDPKTRLQEYLQAKHLALPSYEVINTTGKAHNQIFTVKCEIKHLNKTVIAEGTSRRKAEQEAANLILQELLTKTK